jgi:hypothetical protein
MGCLAQRLGAGGKAVLDLGIGIQKMDAAAVSFASTPGTGGAGVLGGIYGTIGAVGNVSAGILQLAGAATGDVSGFGEAANVATTMTTGLGFATLVATGGNMEAASAAASAESVGTAGVNGGLTGQLIDQGASDASKLLQGSDLG